MFIILTHRISPLKRQHAKQREFIVSAQGRRVCRKIALCGAINFLLILKFVIPNPALSGEGSAFCGTQRKSNEEADPSREAVRDDSYKECLLAGIAGHKCLKQPANIRV
jgi:hypothetical protein